MLADKRLSLGATILRQAPSETVVKWVKSEQMIADVLTTVLPGRYAREALEAGTWTLGPDEHAPNSRGRRLADPDRVEHARQAEGLNKQMPQLASRKKHHDHHLDVDDESEISTTYVVAGNAEAETYLETYFITASLPEVPHPVHDEEFVLTSTANSPTPSISVGKQLIASMMNVWLRWVRCRC